jgi:type III pantothenate kinase
MRNDELKYQLILDIGNTTVKGGVFLNFELVDLFQANHDRWKSDWLFLESKYDIAFKVYSNVSNLELPLNEGWMAFNPFEKKDWTIHYLNPHTMGQDRIAAAMGARSISNAENILVVDLGSCITYTGLKKKQIIGFGISPGRNMRWMAMHQFTDKLPKIDPTVQAENYSKHCTEENLFFGGHVAWKEEILSVCKLLKDQYGFSEVIFTGTDAVYLTDFLGEYMSIVPYLNLIGMNNWLYEI